MGEALRPAPHKDGIRWLLIGAEGSSGGADWRRAEARRGGAGLLRPSPGPLPCAVTMSQARRHLRAALFLAAASQRGATTGTATRRGLAAWPAPQEPGMEYQVAGGPAGGCAMTRGPVSSHAASGLRRRREEPGA